MAKKTSGSETSAEKRLQAFRDRMKKAGLHGGGKPYLSIDIDGGYVEAEYISCRQQKSAKFKNMRTVHTVKVIAAFGRTRDGEQEIPGGIFDLTAGGGLDYRLKDMAKGAHFGAFFKGKVQKEGFKNPIKNYEFYTEEKAEVKKK